MRDRLFVVVARGDGVVLVILQFARWSIREGWYAEIVLW